MENVLLAEMSWPQAAFGIVSVLVFGFIMWCLNKD